MKYVLSNSSFIQPAPLSVCVAATVEKSSSIACAAAKCSSLLSYVLPCVILDGVISAISCFRSINEQTFELRFHHHVCNVFQEEKTRHNSVRFSSPKNLNDLCTFDTKNPLVSFDCI